MMFRSIRSKWFAIAVLLAMIALPGLSAGARVAHAAATVYYVSPTGSDGNPGTSALPFRTIQQAADVMVPGDTCLIASGTYRETVVPARSGTEGLPITFMAEPGATVTVSGTEPVGGWTVYSGSIYVTDMPWSLGHENQLFAVNGGAGVTALWEARWPNIGAYTLPGLRAGMAAMEEGSATAIADSALTQPDGFWNGATVWQRGGDGYLAQTTTVASFDAATHTLGLNPIPDNADYLQPSADSTYFLSGVLGALDAENEWYVDEAAGKLYLWAPGGGTPVHVEAKKRLTAFDLDGTSYIRLAGIRTFAANIRMDGANHDLLDGMRVEYPYFSNESQGYYPDDQDNGGIAVFGSDNEIRNSTIAYSTGTLVKLAGDRNRIVNNDIHDGDYMSSYASLIVLDSGSGNLIGHNTIRDAGRANIYWKRGSAEIAYNDIYNGMWLSRDGGMIYAYGADMGNSDIHHNLIHDNKAYSSGFSLYLDNFTENAVVHHNVIYNGGTGINLNTPGNFKLFYNNTVVDNGKSVDHWGTEPYSEELYGTRMFNNIFTGAVNLTGDTVSGFNIESGAGLKFADAAAHDYRIEAGSAAIDSGAAIPGITDGYAGTAPDIGAYEYGGADWKAGHDFVNPPADDDAPVRTPYMNMLGNSGFELGLDGWSATGEGRAAVVGVAEDAPWQHRGAPSRLRLGGGVDGVEQVVTGLSPNTSYMLVGWMYGDEGEEVNLGVKNYGGDERSASSTDTEYARKEIGFTTGPTDTSATVYVYKSSEGGGYAYADDLGLIETTPFDSGQPGTALKSVELSSAQTIYTVKDKGTLTLAGKLLSGDDADLAGAERVRFASSDKTVVKLGKTEGDGASFTAKKPGQATITATVEMGGIVRTASLTVTVFPKKSGHSEQWQVREYGPNARSYLQKQGGSYTLLGMGDNVWGSSDDFVYLSRYVETEHADDKVTLTAIVQSFSSADPNAAIGLMFRADDGADSKHVHFRVDGQGGLRYSYRNEESLLDAQKPAEEQKYWGSESGVLYIFDKSVTLPVKLKLVKEGDIVTGYYETSAGWTEMGSTTCEFGDGDFLAGVGMFSGQNLTPAQAVITDLKVEIG